MRKLVMVLTAVLLVFAVSAPAFALGVETPDNVWRDGSNTWIAPGTYEGDDDDDDDDHHSSDKTTTETTTETQTPASTVVVIATTSQNVEQLMQVVGANDALLAVTATVPAEFKGKGNPFTFQADALKTADGKAPATIPFTLYKIVGDQFAELTYGVDFIVDWATGEITIFNVTDDCEFLFVPAA